ncbi:hypothetical protein [uncultured Microbacterium sp.]|uniref:hypothetical protein n=1 Tax=uncultured Microbacterium sp. TaxID=191216 RepID=UPI00261CF574|nr:hypothetical protein [uncultured Microbacterium sp.]
MSAVLGAIGAWVVPVLVVFGTAAALSTLAIWALRRRRRSPRARAAAEQERTATGSALVRLDDMIEELDLDVDLSGALYDGTAPAALRRARMTAHRVRDDAFAEFRDLGADTHPDDVRRVSRSIRTRTDVAIASIERARSEHDEWMRSHVTAASQIAAARDRCRRLRAELADPAALLAELAARWDRTEWAEAERDAATAVSALAQAERLIDEAATRASDPTRSTLPILAEAERAVREASSAARRVEERHRLITDAAGAVDGEIASARAALRHALTVREGLETAESERLGAELRNVEAEMSGLEARAHRAPAATVDGLARLRDRIDLAVGDARTAAQRLRGARTALPGTLATARDAISRAEPRAARAGADARVRLAAAHRDLAAARGADNPVDALDAARRALRNAEDAVALADYDVLTKD